MKKLLIHLLSCIAQLGWPMLFLSVVVYLCLAFQCLSDLRSDNKMKSGDEFSNGTRKDLNQELQSDLLISGRTRCPCDLGDPTKSVVDPYFNPFDGLRSNGPFSNLSEEIFNPDRLQTEQLNQEQFKLARLLGLDITELFNHTGNGSYFSQPVDKHEYNYIHNPESLCDRSQGREIILMTIISSPGNKDLRDIIRSTYGKDKNWRRMLRRQSIVQAVFFFGMTKRKHLQMDIDAESDLHGDIVQEDFEDAFEKKTMKTVMALKWVANHCRHATHIVKCDDSCMILQPKFMVAVNQAPSTGWAAGQVLNNLPVSRDIESDYYIDEYFYSLPTYPSFPYGGAYILSADVAKALYQVATTTPLFPLDDVFIGMCLEKLSITLSSIDHFLKHATVDWMLETDKNSFTRQSVKQYAVVSNLDEDHMNLLWDFCRIF